MNKIQKKVKILFFIPQLVGGGAEKVNINIIKILDRNYFDIHLVVTTMAGSVYKQLPDEITLHDLRTPKTIFSILKLRKLIGILSPDIIFSSLIRGHIAITLSMLYMKNKPFIVLRSPNSPKLLLKYNQMDLKEKLLLEYSYRRANMIVAQTPEMRDEIIEYHGINKEKVKVFFNPIDSDAINKKTEGIENPFDVNDINVVAAGRVIYQKGFDVLIKSFKSVIEFDLRFKLYIIGQDVDGEMENLKKLIETLKLTRHVFFLGYQENPYKYFSFSDLYVLSSRWEGLPNTVLENLYLKKPVISTRCIPFMESLIQNGQNGFLVNVEDVDGLSNAIKNYSKIKLEFSNSKNTIKDVNDFFINMRITI